MFCRLRLSALASGLACARWVIPHTPPSGPAEDYINSKVETMTKDLNARPQALLTYEANPNIAPNSNSTQIQITISNKTEDTLKFKSLNVRLEVGYTATALFKKLQNRR